MLFRSVSQSRYDIEDEHDDNGNNKDYTIIGNNSIITNSRVEIEEIEKALNLKLIQEGEDVETIGGLVMLRVGHVPSTGEVISIADNVKAEVLDANSRTIKRLKIKYDGN